MTMIERIARAICHSIDGNEDHWQAFTTAAYDALVAMQDPTKEMLEAPYTPDLSGDTPPPHYAWPLMIDAAFKS